MREWLWPIAKYACYAAIAGTVFHCALKSRAETLRLGREAHRLRVEIARLRQENARRESILHALQADPFYVERVLRERYGYRRPDEFAPPSIGRTAPQPARNTGRVAVARNRRTPRTD